MRIWKCLAACGALASLAAVCRATEPNETFATSTILAPSVRLVSDALTPEFFAQPDTLLGTRDMFGDIDIIDDDSAPTGVGNGQGSGVYEVDTNSGSIDFAVSGYPDDTFDGGHDQFGDYEVIITPYNFFGDPLTPFSVVRNLSPDEVDEFTFFDEEWIGGTYDAWIDNTVGAPTAGDIDFFTFTGLPAGASFKAETLDPTTSGIDTMLGWFATDGTMIALNDDDFVRDVLSTIEGVVPANGRVILAVTGTNDEQLINGSHQEEAPYELRLTLAGELAADFNGDGDVTGADLTSWRNSFGPSATGGDANDDGDSDGGDFLVWQRELGSGLATGAVQGIPEPASIGLLVAALAAGVVCRGPFCR